MKKLKILVLVALAIALVAIPAASQSQAKLVDLEVWMSASVSEAAGPPDDWVVYKIAREKLGINLKIVMLPTSFADMNTKINTAAAGNQLPDIAQMNRDVWITLVKQGLIAPVEDILAKAPNRNKIYYSDPGRRLMATYKGKLYALPDAGKTRMTDGWVIRKDWLDKLGLATPKTLDDFYAVAKAFTEKDPDGNGQNDTYGFGAYVESADMTQAGLGNRFDPIAGAFGFAGMWDVSAANFGYNFRKAEFYDYITFVKKLCDGKLIHPDWATLKKDDFRLAWKQGKFGIMRENFSALHAKANYEPFDKLYPNGQWVPIPPPVGPKGQSLEGMDYLDTRLHAVSKRAVDAGKSDAIARFLEWSATDEAYFLLGYGVKDVNYVLDASGNPTTKGLADATKGYTEKAILPITQLRNFIYRNDDVEFASRYPSFVSIAGRKTDQMATWKFFQSQKWVDSTAAQFIDKPGNWTDIETTYSSGLLSFVKGINPLTKATWTQFIDNLDKLGAGEFEKRAKQQLIDKGFF